MKDIYLGQARVEASSRNARGKLVRREGETWYCIEDFDAMAPFFMTVVSGFDHWMFLSSTGGLTCGRRSPDHALFPYTTDDKVHDAAATTGPVTCLHVDDGDRVLLWQPFAPGARVYRLERRLYKNLEGNRVVFEEINHDLGLTFSYGWNTGDTFGFIRKAALKNHRDQARSIQLLDGLRNLLPSGVDRDLQTSRSTLVDAYKQAEAVEGAQAGLYTLSSLLTDRAEPAESLRATVAWSTGLDGADILLSDDQRNAFCRGGPIESESFKKGKRGAFLLHAGMRLEPGEECVWYTVGDLGLGPSAVTELLSRLRSGVAPARIEEDILAGTHRLRRLVGKADGYQAAADVLATRRHFSNTLFNIMRGGVFAEGYQFPVEDFLDFVGCWNRPLRELFSEKLSPDAAHIRRSEALRLAEKADHPHMQRLVLEYLPLTFSRRHGDPSRPWNHFSIDLRRADGADSLGYQGNWRDIFQNWEALAISYPEFIESFVAKFVNASTPDGYNAYRLSRDGFEWEVLDPDDPWSNIGYWGDHQVGYLYRLLELSRRYHPGALETLLSQDLFVYADVPYRLKPYRQQLEDPRNTIEFDGEREDAVLRRVKRIGSDGKLVTGPDGEILTVNLLEKLLVPALGKLTNLVPGGGIWMNTQRPEWNDANNALVGYGLSMVTLYYLRRYVSLLIDLLGRVDEESIPVSDELARFFDGLDQHLARHEAMLCGPVNDQQRKQFLDGSGALSDDWRSSVNGGFSGRRRPLARARVVAFLERARRCLDQTVRANRRQDGLYHSYNLVHFEENGYTVEHLEEMLEGQVAVLSSGLLGPSEGLALLEALEASALYREDQQSYMLYPDHSLPRFEKKNVIPEERIAELDWLLQRVGAGNTDLVERDELGRWHFNGDLKNADALAERLERTPGVSPAEARQLGQLYEDVFDHRRFKGRSGSMYKYEGLGCIYWHMVSKLALAIAELRLAAGPDADHESLDRLSGHYRAVRDSLGVHKTPAAYGAFTTDPYSHTPGFNGVQQPGLTGQVKEDVIARFLELGVLVDRGQLRFRPVLMDPGDFLSEDRRWRYSDGDGERVDELEAGTLAFLLCGVPVEYSCAQEAAVEIEQSDGRRLAFAGDSIPAETSLRLFQRDGSIRRIRVALPRPGGPG